MIHYETNGNGTYDDPVDRRAHLGADGSGEYSYDFDGLDGNGEPDGFFDVHNYIAMCRAHYDKVGIGADYVNKLFR